MNYNYTPTNWKDRIGAGLNKYKDLISGTPFEFIQTPDNVQEEGTLVEAQYMNNLEEGMVENFKEHVELKGLIDINATNIGDLSTLGTTDKSSAVNAINEVNSKVANLTGEWMDIDLLNGWYNSGPPFANAQYKVENNTVFFRGLIRTNVNPTNNNTLRTFFILPYEHRTIYRTHLPTLYENAGGVQFAAAAVVLGADTPANFGEVRVNNSFTGTASGWVTLDGASFSLDA